MTREYLKKAKLTSSSDASDVRQTVQTILDEIEAGGDAKALEYGAKFDNYTGPVLLSEADIAAAAAKVPQKLEDDIAFAHDNVRRFAGAQKATITDMQMEIAPGLIAGQKAIPVNAAGCYAPGGRYAHIASAMMTVTTAKVAGCAHITACSPPRADTGIHPAIIYSADLCGADQILARGLGRIINIASLQSERAFPNGIAYGASKGGITQLTRAMAEAWSAHGITANAIAPGFFLTELTAAVFNDPERAARNAAQTCIGRNGRMEDLAGPAVFLASDASGYVTGQVLNVDGGFTAK